MSAPKIDVILGRWPEYLALHQQDPRRYPLEVEEYAAHVGMSKVTIYTWAKRDQGVREIIDAIRTGRPADSPAPPAPVAVGTEVLDTAMLQREVHDLLRLASNACKQFVAEYQRHHLEDAPLTAWQLEQTASKLLNLAQQVRPKRDAILRQQRGDAQPSLFLQAHGKPGIR